MNAALFLIIGCAVLIVGYIRFTNAIYEAGRIRGKK